MLADVDSQFTAKQLNRQAAKAGKDEVTEKGKLKKVFDPRLRYLFPCKALDAHTSFFGVGNPARPRRYCKDLRAEQHPQAK
jgi:hypothetical protein